MNTDILAGRLDNVRDLLSRTDLSPWARSYWQRVESDLVRYWTVAVGSY